MTSPSDVSAKRTANRDKFPQTAKIVDAFRKAFGADQVKVLWAMENGKEVGKRPEWIDADQHQR